VNVSARTQYACLAVLELAARYEGGEPVRVRDIAQSHDIPSRFLVQILLQLKGAGLATSTRGAAGGYQLTRDPADITLAEVMQVVEGSGTSMIRTCLQETPQARALADAWTDAEQAQTAVLAATTFRDLLQRSRGDAHLMYYI
jgi:Rrf2 family protein